MTIFYGTNDSDKINGSIEGDRLQGYGGDDWLSGGLGSDSIYGGDGDDILFAGKNLVDQMTGEEPEIDERLIYYNLLDGGDGEDLLVGSHLNDLEIGGDGEDLLLGYRGDDLLIGGQDNDSLRGHRGADTLLGGSGDDTLLGFEDDDVLDGGSGNDDLYGRNDYGSPGNSNIDSFTGGSGEDKFILGTAYETFYQVGQDLDLAIIEDFDSEQDMIRLNGDSGDYSLRIDTMMLGGNEVMGTYIDYDLYTEGETIGFRFCLISYKPQPANIYNNCI